MQMPFELRAAIEEAASRFATNELAQAAAEVSENYLRRKNSSSALLDTNLQRAAYSIVRMPATFAAVRAVLCELKRRMPEVQATSLLDLGAGTGAGMWAASEIFDALQNVTCVEKDAGLIKLGKSFAQNSTHTAVQTAQWTACDMGDADSFAARDLVVCSYSLGESETEIAKRILRAGLNAARKVFVLIEPGTMRGFYLVKTLRDDAIRAGWHIVAPCPHDAACPMNKNDWCHFSTRLERTALHRRLKAGALGYEDEKFSYFIASKIPLAQAQSRIVRHPFHQPGFIQLKLCGMAGLVNLTVTRKDKTSWKRARKVEWGDAWE
ncbi:MAG: small ribosomal subunit Rsm22 family protein [Pyrinomonadaceae bacterium]